jgi:hypothetical protein
VLTRASHFYGPPDPSALASGHAQSEGRVAVAMRSMALHRRRVAIRSFVAHGLRESLGEIQLLVCVLPGLFILRRCDLAW